MKYRDRIKELIRVPASELLANPLNFREHSDTQRAVMEGILGEIGYIDGLIAFRNKKKQLIVINGHLRRDISGDETVPVLVVDLTEAEAKKALATFDPVGALATTNAEALGKIRDQLKMDDAAADAMLRDLAGNAAPVAKDVTTIKQLSVQPPPAMAWVLIGIPTVRFGEIAQRVEALAKVPGITIETVANNG